MPKHRPIRFNDPSFSEEAISRVREFAKKHPIATSVSSAILATAIMGGVITTAAMFPGAMKFLGKGALDSKFERKRRYRRLWERFHSLRKRNIFQFVRETSEGELIYHFTSKGREFTRKFLLRTLELEIPKKWDEKWRIVIFDIPEKFKKTRKIFQSKLRELGFYPFQKSVWIHPFPCEQEISFIKDFLRIKPYVEVFIVDDMPSGKIIYYFRKLLKKAI